ncbi:ATP-binding protein [Archaeoglobales archaeon]|nr:MAG: ATP-binding protein [Archaeoglobales archaeon]
MEEKIVTAKDIAEKMDKIKHKIAVGSGKGGVGKSTVTALLAVHLARKGKRVGIFDVDFFGPSIPKFFGVDKKYYEFMVKKTGLSPVHSEKYGIEVTSIHFTRIKKEAPIMWEGEKINAVIRSFLGSVDWDYELDYLLFDLPPGTGDAILTIIDFVELDGLIIVTTPQDLSVSVVEKTIKMVRETETGILGIIENMSYFKCPECGEKNYVFGKSKVSQMAEEYNIGVVAEIPLDLKLIKLAERGRIEDYPFDYFGDFLVSGD